MKIFLPIIPLPFVIGALIFTLTLTWSKAHTKRECAAWMQKTGEITRIANHQCYVLEGNQFVPLAQRKLDAEIQRQSQ